MALASLALAYVIIGRLGLLLAVPPGYATAIFPPAGIAVAAAFIGGRSTLPWIFVGSFVLNLWCGYDHAAALVPVVAAVIAAASVLQASLAARLLRYLVGYPATLDNARDVGRSLLVAPVVCITSPTLSLSIMALLGVMPLAALVSNWFAWWIGDTLGVLLFLPLVLVVAGEPRAFWWRRAPSVALPMLLFFAVFVAIFVRTTAWERDQALAPFQLQSQGLIDRLRAQFDAQENFLTQLSASWEGPAPLSRQDFALLTRNLLLRDTAIQAVEWAPRVARADRDAFIAAQRQMVPDFAIKERASPAGLATVPDRAEFYPVTYVEPEQGNQAAIGFDLASDATRRAAIARTMTDGMVAATAPVTLVQAPQDRTGILLIQAVPQGANGAGVLLVVLRMDRLVSALIGHTSELIALRLVDRETGRPLFNTLANLPAAYQDQSLTFGGRNYGIDTGPTPNYLAEHKGWQSWTVLVVGVLSTTLLGAFLLVTTGEHQRFERLLRERTRERDRIWQVSEDLLGVSSFEGYFMSVNPAWTATLGWSEHEICTTHVDDLRHPDDYAVGTESRQRLAEGAGTVRMENRFRHKNGSYRWIYWTMTAEQGLIYLIGRDVTADREAAQMHRQTEEQLRQLQKMDSVGQLTGGIAHDFNNLLTVIIGNLEVLENLLDTGAARALKCVRAAMSGATRAATLTQRLLSYAQRQPLRPGAVDLNELVTGMGDLIRRTQGELIDYEFALSPNLPLCFCDANQLETALLNLVINARDAMPEGGRLTIQTAQINCDSAAARMRGIAVGPYLTLAVSDTGVGMSRETVERAFEPFYTTKEIGKGTGLGLSMAYGFAKQSKGHIEIESKLGAGSTVRLLLPALVAKVLPGAHGPEPTRVLAELRGAGQTILVTEDDDGVRGYIVAVLTDLNYRVLEASDGPAALAIIGRPNEHIDLLLTDVVMPEMNGRELASRARSLLPNIRVLFMTGYSEDAIVHQGRLDPDVELIEKPFRRETLAARVLTMLQKEQVG